MSYVMMYVLDDNDDPVPMDDILVWSKFVQRTDRHVGDDMIGDVRVSTVFLGLDHSFDDGIPLLWETMIFGGDHDKETWRWATKTGAIDGHLGAIKLVRKVPI